MVMAREYCSADPNKAEQTLETFSLQFKERFNKFYVEHRYSCEPKVLYIITKSQGDILMEMRSIESAILTYKELVTRSLADPIFRKTSVKRSSCTLRRWLLTRSLGTATGWSVTIP